MNWHVRPVIFKLLSILGLTAGVAICAAQQADSAPETIAPARQAELIHLVRQDCGSCHGLTLNGGLGPALLPETLKDRSPEYLKAAILFGMAPNAMPPWQRFLNDAEAQWIVVKLKKGFPSGH